MDNKDEIEREAQLAMGRRALEEKGPQMRVEGGLGGSPVPPMQQLRVAAITLLHESLRDGDGALLQVLEQDIRQEEALFGSLTQGLTQWTHAELRRRLFSVLGTLAGRPLKSAEALAEFTRRADAMWGQLFSARPHFERAGQAPHAEDPYTHESVRALLTQFVALASNDASSQQDRV